MQEEISYTLIRLASEYYRLCMLLEPTEDDLDRLGDILELAVYDEALDEVLIKVSSMIVESFEEI